MRRGGYIKCKESRNQPLGYGPEIFKVRSNTLSVINNMTKSKPNSVLEVKRVNGTVVVRTVKK